MKEEGTYYIVEEPLKVEEEERARDDVEMSGFMVVEWYQEVRRGSGYPVTLNRCDWYDCFHETWRVHRLRLLVYVSGFDDRMNVKGKEPVFSQRVWNWSWVSISVASVWFWCWLSIIIIGLPVSGRRMSMIWTVLSYLWDLNGSIASTASKAPIDNFPMCIISQKAVSVVSLARSAEAKSKATLKSSSYSCNVAPQTSERHFQSQNRRTCSGFWVFAGNQYL